jgi:peptidyl-prolyl cis-trans isomerase A (cyclophilin A)
MRKFAFLACLALGGLMAQTAAQAPAAGAPAKPARPDGLYTTISTTQGDIVIQLFEKESPITVKNYMDLALGRKAWTDPKTGQRVRRPLFNGLIFHRVIPGFMIQGGDPEGTGYGGTDKIVDEFYPTLKFDIPGRLAMANSGSPGSGSSQFFITDGTPTHLNGKHTIFGQVVEGMAVVKAITAVPRNSQDKPNTPVVMKKVTFERVGPGAPINPVPAAAPKAAPKAPATATKAPATATKAPAAAKPPTMTTTPPPLQKK